MSKVVVQLLSWNGRKYLPLCFESLFNQSFKDFSLLVLDNDSKDGSREWLIEQQKLGKYNFHLLLNDKNNGFAGGHNKLFIQHGASYVLLLNQDILLDKDYLANLVSLMDANPQAGAVGGVLYRWPDSSHVEQNCDFIDSLGLRLFDNGRVIELGQGWPGHDAPVKAKQVFGVSGALPLYRRAALNELKDKHGEYFDNDFFAYKEDVDLAYRLRLLGWQAWVEPKARAWHDRTISGQLDLSDKTALKNRQGRHQIGRFYSYRNHLLVLFKNVPLVIWQKFGYKIFWYELKKFIYLLCVEPKVWWFAWKELIGHNSKWLEKRRSIQKTKRVLSPEIFDWYNM